MLDEFIGAEPGIIEHRESNIRDRYMRWNRITGIDCVINRILKVTASLPGNKLIQLGKHLIDLNPVL